MKGVVITGGLGYLGIPTAKLFLENGWRVKIIDKGIFLQDYYFENYNDRVEIALKDIRDVEYADVEGYDACVHYGGFSNDPVADFSKEVNMDVNCEGTRKVAQACALAGVNNFSFASSASLYDTNDPTTSVVVDESATPTANSHYSKSKLAAEKALLEVAQANPNFNPVMFRQATVYGYSPKLRLDLVVNIMVKKALENGRITIHNGGLPKRPMLSVKDCARAHFHLHDAHFDNFSKFRNEVFNISENNYTVRAMAMIIKDYYESHYRKDLVIEDITVDRNRSYLISGKKFCEKTGFSYDSNIGSELLELFDEIKKLLKAEVADDTIYYTIDRVKELREWGDFFERLAGKPY